MLATRVLLPAALLGLLLLGGCRPPVARFSAAPPPVTATTAAGDDATVTRAGDQTIVTVTSATGIGSLELAWPAAAPPAALTLHLHLQGLEGLTLASADASVTASVASRPPYGVTESAALDGAAPAPIGPDSPYWSAITITPAGAAIPLDSGYFAVQVSPQLLREAQGSLTVQWIDFYR